MIKYFLNILKTAFSNRTPSLSVDIGLPPVRAHNILSDPTITNLLPTIPADTRKWTGLVVHHSESKDTASKDADAIAKYHMSYRIDYTPVTEEEFNRRQAIGDGKVFQKPWKAVAYNFLVERVGSTVCLIPGRPLSWVGAHAGWESNEYYNENYIGLCVIGNFNNTPPDEEKLRFTIKVIQALMSYYGFSKYNVIGHRETYAKFGVSPQKTCPGTAFDLDKLRSML